MQTVEIDSIRKYIVQINEYDDKLMQAKKFLIIHLEPYFREILNNSQYEVKNWHYYSYPMYFTFKKTKFSDDVLYKELMDKANIQVKYINYFLSFQAKDHEDTISAYVQASYQEDSYEPDEFISIDEFLGVEKMTGNLNEDRKAIFAALRRAEDYLVTAIKEEIDNGNFE